MRCLLKLIKCDLMAKSQMPNWVLGIFRHNIVYTEIPISK